MTQLPMELMAFTLNGMGQFEGDIERECDEMDIRLYLAPFQWKDYAEAERLG